MRRQFIRIPLLMFWPGSSPFDFHKTSEGPSCLIKDDQRKNNNIFGRHASNGPNTERNFATKGGIDFSVTKFRFCDKYKKAATNTSEGNRVFGVSDKVSKHDVSLTQEKVLDIQNKYMQLIVSPKTTIMELTKLLEKLSFTAQAVLPGRIQCRYLQQQKIQAVRETNSCQIEIKLSQHSLAELKWWKENLLFQNGKPLKKGMPRLIIQTNVSKKS